MPVQVDGSGAMATRVARAKAPTPSRKFVGCRPGQQDGLVGHEPEQLGEGEQAPAEGSGTNEAGGRNFDRPLPTPTSECTRPEAMGSPDDARTSSEAPTRAEAVPPKPLSRLRARAWPRC